MECGAYECYMSESLCREGVKVDHGDNWKDALERHFPAFVPVLSQSRDTADKVALPFASNRNLYGNPL